MWCKCVAKCWGLYPTPNSTADAISSYPHTLCWGPIQTSLTAGVSGLTRSWLCILLICQVYQSRWASLWFVPPRLIVRSGNCSLSPPLFDSDLDDVPERGLLSESSTLYLELTADSSSIPLLLALRYEGEQHRRSTLSFLFFYHEPVFP